MKKVSLFFVFLIFCLQSSFAQKVGLVFSGGGAKGAAHIGVIKALEENNIPIDYITGTSAGAIVGSLYAMGYTPEEMLELMMSKEFGYWQTGTVEDEYQYYFKSQTPTPSFGHFSIDFTDSLEIKTNILPQSLINPIQMNQAFMSLYTQSSAMAGWNFDNLFVPFRCVASDVYNKKPIIYKNGDLGDAVRASMTFPFFFQPIWKDSVPIFDGGIYDNFPVQPMKDAFSPDIIIGSTVSSGNNKPSSNIYNQIETMIMQKQEYTVSKEDGLMISFKFPDVSLLDFNKAKELMDIGYEKTINLIDSIKSRIERRVPLEEVNHRRKEYRESLPPLIFQNIYISGVPESQQKYIESQIHRDINKVFSFEEFKRVYFKILSSSKIKEIIPHATYNRKTKKFDLYLNIKIKDELKINFGGNISSHQANQLFLGLNYQYLRRYAVDTKVNLQVGNAFNGVNMNGRIYLNTNLPTYLQLEGTYSTKRYSESQSLFYEDVQPAFIKQKELFVKAKLGVPFLNRAKAEIGLAYGKLTDDYYQSTKIMSYNSEYDKSSYNLLATSLNIEENTLDYKQYPINGTEKFLTAHFVVGKEHYTPSATLGEASKTHKNINWLQIKGHWQKYHNLSNMFNLGYMSELVISSKNLMQNYTASVLQAPAFTPTPHSKIVFNEAFRANQYLATGITPIIKFTKMLHFRLELYGFSPLYEIKKKETTEPYYKGKPYYGDFMHAFEYMGEAALVFQLPFASISLYGNGYSYPSKNFNFGVNIGFLIFNSKMID